MKLLFIPLIFFFYSSIIGQNYYSHSIGQNSTNATVSSGGVLFSKFTVGTGYEVPKGSKNHTIFSFSICMGAKDVNDDLHLSAIRDLRDAVFFPGPFSSNNSYNEIDFHEQYANKVWAVSKEEIIYHIDNYQNPSYEIPWSILNWPANGNVALGVANDLAPYIDVNSNGIYEPQLGEYPCIKGDAATFSIMNDDVRELEIGGENLGVEIQMMTYQYNTNDLIDTTTFLNIKVINRSQNDYTDFRFSTFIDPDIGFAFDDYIGCDSTRNLGYGYNASSFDPGGFGAPGYGNSPPAMGFMLLNGEMGSFITYVGSSSPIGDPSTPEDYWNYLNGRWKDGQDLVFGGNGYPGSIGSSGQSTNFLYSGDPFLGQGWTEMNVDGMGLQNPTDEDKRMIFTAEEIGLNAGEAAEYDYALVYSGGLNYLENVGDLFPRADFVQDFYDNEITNEDCLVTGSGIQDEEEVSISPNRLFEITRLDGEGNMSMGAVLHPDTEEQILQLNSVDSVRYSRGKGPIYVERADTVNYQMGYYIIKILDPLVNESDWRIYRYTEQGGSLLDSLDGNTTLLLGDTVLLSQYGLKVAIRQDVYQCFNQSEFCPTSQKQAFPIEASLEFENENLTWLEGVPASLGFNQQNWQTSGLFPNTPNTPFTPNPSLGFNDPACYSFSERDPFMKYWGLLGGIITASQYTRFSGCGPLPIQVPTSIISQNVYGGTIGSSQATIFNSSVDIVMTPDSSLWTRCAVIELNNDETTSLGGALPGMLRQSPSVDKNGNPDGTGVGMSWFPGYAIDVETGRRLNLAFCENSLLSDENGTDMIWNPTSVLYNANGDAVFGGQHTVYVFGGELHGMPVYDEGEFIRTNLLSQTVSEYRNVYRSLSWVFQPMLSEGHSLLETSARVSLRINKEFKVRELSNENEGKPMFGFQVSQFEPSLFPLVNQTKNKVLKAFPNPAKTELIVVWENLNATDVFIVGLDGRAVFSRPIATNQESMSLDVSGFKSGLYFVRIGDETVKIVIH